MFSEYETTSNFLVMFSFSNWTLY